MTPAMQTLMREIARVWDEAATALYDAGDPGPAIAALSQDVRWTEFPSGAGGTGSDAVARHLTAVAATLPAGLPRTRLSRTLDVRRVADEVRCTVTHDRELSWLLPGLAPTARTAEVLAVHLVRIRQNRIEEVRTLWDVDGLRADPADFRSDLGQQG